MHGIARRAVSRRGHISGEMNFLSFPGVAVRPHAMSCHHACARVSKRGSRRLCALNIYMHPRHKQSARASGRFANGGTRTRDEDAQQRHPRTRRGF